MQSNQPQAVVALLQPAQAARCDARLALLLAAAYEIAGEADASTQTLQEANARWPENVSLGASLARVYAQQHDYAHAAHALEHCVAKESTPLQELQVIAVVELQAHNLKRAEQAGAFAFEAQPSRPALLFLANVLQLQGRSQDVVKLLNAHRAEYGSDPAFLITTAESENDAGLYLPARQDLQQALMAVPNSYPAHYVLGNVLVKTGDLAGAIREYQTAATLSPAQPRTWFQMGKAYEMEQREADAVTALRKALSLDDQYAPAYCELGKIEMRKSETAEAIAHLQRARTVNPAYSESWFLLVQAYARAGNKEKSRTTLDEWNAYKRAHPLQAADSHMQDPSLATLRK